MKANDLRLKGLNKLVTNSQYSNQVSYKNLMLGGLNFFKVAKGAKASKMVISLFEATDENKDIAKQLDTLYARITELRTDAWNISQKFEGKAASTIKKYQKQLDAINDEQKLVNDSIKELIELRKANSALYRYDIIRIAFSKAGLTKEQQQEELEAIVYKALYALSSLCGDSGADIYDSATSKFSATMKDKREKDDTINFDYVETVISNFHKALRKHDAYITTRTRVKGRYAYLKQLNETVNADVIAQ